MITINCVKSYHTLEDVAGSKVNKRLVCERVELSASANVR